MAKNDMEVIIYKILMYLYIKMQNGQKADFIDICWKSTLFDIPENYWKSIIAELIDNKLVKGFTYTNTKDGMVVQMHDDATITFKGREFLINNSEMQKAKKFLGIAFEILLSQII